MSAAGPVLDCPATPSETGAYRLSWSATGDVRLYEDDALVYQGPDDATTVTGRPERSYAYRLEAGGGEARCEVRVEPPSMAFAAGLLGAGLLVFVATVVLIVVGHRAHVRGELS